MRGGCSPRCSTAPGGLKIQTIHSFAQGLLAAFPAEAGIAPGIQPIEGRAEQELVRRTLAELMADAEATGDERLTRDIQSFSRRLGEAGAVDYLQACARKADAMTHLGEGDDDRADDPPADGPARGLNRRLYRRQVRRRGLRLRPSSGGRGGQPEVGRAKRVGSRRDDRAVAGPDPDRARRRAAALRKIVLTEKGHAAGVGRPVKAEPHYEANAGRLANLVGELLHIQNGARLARDISAGLRAGQAFAAAYTRAKRSAGVADFNDLIEWTRRLLAQPGMGDWVRYKLDRRVDHVLVDEAQDTNAAQWEIIERLVDEYFSGSSEAEERHRTLFMVGDFKQAIYGFQGTDPKRFDEARRRSGSARPRLAMATICSATSGGRASFATCRSRPASARRSRCSMSSMR